LKTYNSSLYKIENIFIDKTKPKYKTKYFPIMISKRKIKEIEMVMIMINLLIDYLLFVKDFSSSFIPLAEKYPVQIGILFDLFEKNKIIKDKDAYLVPSSLLINTLFCKRVKKILKRILYLNQK